MIQVGKRLYYDKQTGDVFFEISEQIHHFDRVEVTVDDDITTWKPLSERNRDTFDVIELEYGTYTQDFRECSGYRVNPETKELEFSYPDPNNPEAPPVYQKPLTEQIADIRTELKSTQDTLDFLLLG